MPFQPTSLTIKPEKQRALTESEKIKKTRAQSAEERVVLEEERVFRRGVVSVMDLIAPASFKVDPHCVQMGSVFARTIFVVTYPRYIGVGWSSPVINLNYSLDIGMFFYPVKSEIILKQLKKKVGALEAQILSDAEKGAARDPLRETALRDIEKLRDDLTQGTEHFFQFAFYVTLYASTVEKLDKMSEDVESIFGSKLIYTKRVFFQAEQGFNSTLPLGNDELMITFNMNSSPIASSFPFISSDLTSDNGILYGINRHNNSLILFDRFSLQNANMVVFATSGAGKSVASDTPVLIRDKKGVIALRPIGEVVDELANTKKFEKLDEELEGVINPGLFVYTFNNHLEGEWSAVGVAARKQSPENLYRITTKSGRCITVTADHNMVVLRGGVVTSAKSDDVHVGEYIPVPHIAPEPARPTSELDVFALLAHVPRLYVAGCSELIRAHLSVLRARTIDAHYDAYLLQYSRSRRVPFSYFLNILDVLGLSSTHVMAHYDIRIGSSRHATKDTSIPARLRLTPEFMRLLGYIVSEGTITHRYVIISQTDKETHADIAHCLQMSGIRYFNRKTEGSFVISSRAMVMLINMLGARGRSANKRVPQFIFNVSNNLCAEFIRAYFEGDGGVERHAISATSKSSGLISDMSYLLFRYGIVARIAKRHKHATNSSARGIYSMLTISGQKDLTHYAEIINFVSKRKNASLASILDKQSNTNCDIIPVRDVVKKLYTIGKPLFKGMQDVIDIKNGAYAPSRTKLRELADECKKRVLAFESREEVYRELAELPELEAVVSAGSASSDNNRKLWSTLGGSWRLMKQGSVAPRARNVIRAIETLWGTSYDVGYVKRTLCEGFRELDISVKGAGKHLSDVWGVSYRQNTQYELLQCAAERVWDEYQTMKKRIPEICQLIAQLIGLADSETFWDPIAHIEKIPSTHEFVYDLTVDNEVFLAGSGGLFVHNSFAIKLEILRSLMLGTDVIVIDPEMEYKHLSDAVGGTYINISLSSKNKVNPFDLPRPREENYSVDDIIRNGVITVKGLIRIMLGGRLTTEEDSIIDRALLETYAKKDIVPGVNLATVEMPILQDFVNILEGMEGAKDLVTRLKKFTEGTFAGLFNAPTNVDINNQLVIFSVRDLEDELRPLAIYSIVNYIWAAVRSNLKKRILAIDEAWWLMQNEDSAKFVFALVKRCRKYFLGITTITQDVNDFLTSPYGQAIVNNSALQLLMKQSPAAIDQIAKTFLLTQSERYLLLESAVGEGIFFAGNKHAAIKVVASYTEDQLITTDPQQLLQIEQAKREFAENAAAQGKGGNEDRGGI